MEPEGEGRDDPEVSTSSADRPEEIRIDIGRSSLDLTIGPDDLSLDDVVAREPVLAAQPAVPTAKCESGDPRVGHDASRGREAKELGLAIHISPKGSPLNPHGLGFWIDVDTTHG